MIFCLYTPLNTDGLSILCFYFPEWLPLLLRDVFTIGLHFLAESTVCYSVPLENFEDYYCCCAAEWNFKFWGESSFKLHSSLHGWCCDFVAYTTHPRIRFRCVKAPAVTSCISHITCLNWPNNSQWKKTHRHFIHHWFILCYTTLLCDIMNWKWMRPLFASDHQFLCWCIIILTMYADTIFYLFVFWWFCVFTVQWGSVFFM